MASLHTYHNTCQHNCIVHCRPGQLYANSVSITAALLYSHHPAHRHYMHAYSSMANQMHSIQLHLNLAMQCTKHVHFAGLQQLHL